MKTATSAGISPHAKPSGPVVPAASEQPSTTARAPQPAASAGNGSLPFWKRSYYSYVDGLVSFLTPPGASAFRASAFQASRTKKVAFPAGAKHDYVIACDVLGHVSDVGAFMRDAARAIPQDGRIVITQYSALWEPVLRLASLVGLRAGQKEQNWLTKLDIRVFARLSGLEVVKSGTKMIMPLYIPGVSWFLNAILANIWPFTHLGLFNWFVLRKAGPRIAAGQKPTVSIVIPARNEAGTIEKMVKELPELGGPGGTELIFIEGNSTDRTFQEIERVAKEYGSKRKIIYGTQMGRGKGDAVRRGFGMATGDILMIYDADMTVPPEEIRAFYDALAENAADFANGSRLVYPLEQESMRVINFFGNKFFSAAFSWILGEPLKDTLCGTKVLWRSDYQKIERGRAFFGDFDPFGDFDLIFGAAKLNLKIIDIPVHYKQRIYGTTNISRWKHGWLLLRMTWFAARKIRFI